MVAGDEHAGTFDRRAEPGGAFEIGDRLLPFAGEGGGEVIGVGEQFGGVHGDFDAVFPLPAQDIADKGVVPVVGVGVGARAPQLNPIESVAAGHQEAGFEGVALELEGEERELHRGCLPSNVTNIT